MTATDSMSPSELAAWAREQHESLVALTKVIKQHIAAMPETVAAEWLHGLRTAFDRLRVHLERDFETQESGGYMKNLLELRPWMSNEIDRLQSEHSQILRMADRIKTDLAQTQASDRLLIGDICARTSRFMSVVSQHEQRENTFTLLVFNEELGGEG